MSEERSNTDSLFATLTGGDAGDREVPVGSTLAKVDRYISNKEKGNVGLKLTYPHYATSEWTNYQIVRKDGTENKRGNAMLVTMFNKIGIPTPGPSKLGESFEQLVDKWWTVNITKNGKWKNIEFTGAAATPERAERQNKEAEPNDDDLPF